jgi:hypothetical protein
MVQPIIKQDRYEKISDDLYILGNNTILRFNVILAKKADDGRRFHFHKEFEYVADKYIEKDKLITIRRTFDFYLSIENMRNNDAGYKEFIMIRVQDMLYVQDQFRAACRWFTGKEHQNLYAMNKGKLVMLGKVEPIEIMGLAMEKYIKMEPIVLEYDGVYSPGIRIYISSMNNFVDISVDKFMGLVYLISNINLYQSAQLMINYLQRPEYGSNMYNFNGPETNIQEQEGFIETKNSTRKIENKKKQKSFFDKMDDLE